MSFLDGPDCSTYGYDHRLDRGWRHGNSYSGTRTSRLRTSITITFPALTTRSDGCGFAGWAGKLARSPQLTRERWQALLRQAFLHGVTADGERVSNVMRADLAGIKVLLSLIAPPGATNATLSSPPHQILTYPSRIEIATHGLHDSDRATWRAVRAGSRSCLSWSCPRVIVLQRLPRSSAVSMCQCFVAKRPNLFGSSFAEPHFRNIRDGYSSCGQHRSWDPDRYACHHNQGPSSILRGSP